MDDWQPAETAPKTVPPTSILVCGGDLGRPVIVYWRHREQCWCADGDNLTGQFPYEFEYWMHLPDPPVSN